MSVAIAYAKALFEAASDKKMNSQELDLIETQLEAIERVMADNAEARVAFTSPVLSAKEKSSIVQAIASQYGFLDLVKQFLMLLAQKGRFELIGQIRQAYKTARLESEGGILGKLISADPMESADIQSLSSAFSKKLGKQVAFTTSVDTALLAGMKIIVNGVTYDGSLRAQLQRLRDRLTFVSAAN